MSSFLRMFKASVFALLLLVPVCLVGFTSCDDDDKEDAPAGSPVGNWTMTHIKIVEDGEAEEGDITAEWGVCTLTINADGTYSYYSLTHDEEEGEDELVQESGAWTYANNILTLTHTEDAGYQYIAKMTVQSLTASKMVTYQQDGSDSETRTWSK